VGDCTLLTATWVGFVGGVAGKCVQCAMAKKNCAVAFFKEIIFSVGFKRGVGCCQKVDKIPFYKSSSV